MKKVLILCDYFPPHSGPRMGYLVKYLSRLGWESYVVAGELPSRGGFEALTGFAKEVHIIPQKSHRKWNLLHILPFFWPYDYLRGEYDMMAVARRIVHDNKIDIVLVSCTFGFFPLNVAREISKKYALPLVVDLRDLIEQCPQESFWKRSFLSKIDFLRSKCSIISRARYYRVLRTADALISVAPWHVQFLKKNYNAKTFLVYNGYDPEIFKPSELCASEKFNMIYTGTLGSISERKYQYLFDAVKTLDQQGIITVQDFKVEFYCGKFGRDEMLRRVKTLGVDRYFEFKDFVSAQTIPMILNSASILLLSTYRGGRGVFTTKFFEYLAVNKPILCFPNDNDVLSEVIQDTHAGFVADSVEEMVEFLLQKIEDWRKTGHTIGTTDLQKTTIFSREFQANQFSKIMKDCIQNRRHVK